MWWVYFADAKIVIEINMNEKKCKMKPDNNAIIFKTENKKKLMNQPQALETTGYLGKMINQINKIT